MSIFGVSQANTGQPGPFNTMQNGVNANGSGLFGQALQMAP